MQVSIIRITRILCIASIVCIASIASNSKHSKRSQYSVYSGAGTPVSLSRSSLAAWQGGDERELAWSLYSLRLYARYARPPYCGCLVGESEREHAARRNVLGRDEVRNVRHEDACLACIAHAYPGTTCSLGCTHPAHSPHSTYSTALRTLLTLLALLTMVTLAISCLCPAQPTAAPGLRWRALRQAAAGSSHGAVAAATAAATATTVPATTAAAAAAATT